MNLLFSSLTHSDVSNVPSTIDKECASAQSPDENQPINLQVAQLKPMLLDYRERLANKEPSAKNTEVDTHRVVSFSAAPFWQQQREYYQQAGPKLWQQGLIGNDITLSPTTVNSYCQLIVKYLLDGLHNGAINHNLPVYVLELGAGCGRFAILVLRRLETLVTEYGLEDLNLCYLISDSSEKNRHFIENHPYLQPFLHAGKAKVIDADSHFFSKTTEQSNIIDYQVVEHLTENEEFINNQGIKNKPVSDYSEEQLINASVKNPLIVMTNNFLSRLPQELFYLHYGQLYSAELAVSSMCIDDNYCEEKRNDENINTDTQQKEPEKSEPEAKPWHYRWKKIDNLDAWLAQQDKSVQPLLKQQLTHYLAQLPHQPLLLPTGALTGLSQLQQQHPQGMLLLTADSGPTALVELKQVELTPLALTPSGVDNDQLIPAQLTQLALSADNNNQLYWPVNFLSLQQWAAQNAGISRTIKQQSNGIAFNVSIIDPEQLDFVMTKQATQQFLVNQSPVDSYALIKSLQGAVNVLTERQILSYIRSSGYAPKLLALFLPRLLKQGVSINDRLAWCDVLSEVWQNYVPIGEEGETEEFAFKLALLAIDLSHWLLAKACFISCLQWQGESTAVFHNLALMFVSTGETDLALKFTKQAILLSPDDQQAKELQANITGYQTYCAGLCWFHSDAVDETIPGKMLSLTPLADHHFNEFWLQYRDLQIAQLTRSYNLSTLADVQVAIQHWQADKYRASYAVVHKEFGLVGCTSLEFSQQVSQPTNGEKQLDNEAYFSFWIGTDYQNMGFGQQAAMLCIEQAKAIAEQGFLDYLVTSVWSFNKCSIHVLEKVGFKPLDFVLDEDINSELKQTQLQDQVGHQEVFYCLPLLVDELTDEMRGKICERMRENRDK